MGPVLGVARLEPRAVITPHDAEVALASLGADVRPGDAVFFHTGWGTLWDVDIETYVMGELGPGLELAGRLAGRRVALTGCDTWSPVPPEDPAEPFVVPQTLNTRHAWWWSSRRARRARRRRRPRVRARDLPRQAARRHRRMGRAARHRLTVEPPWRRSS